jgi:hypothetical protein
MTPFSPPFGKLALIRLNPLNPQKMAPDDRLSSSRAARCRRKRLDMTIFYSSNSCKPPKFAEDLSAASRIRWSQEEFKFFDLLSI